MMIKKTALILVTALLLACLCPLGPAEAPDDAVDLPYAGITFTPPEAYQNTRGLILTDGAMELVPGIQYAYWIYCAVEPDDIASLYGNPNITDIASILFYVFSVGNGMTFDDMNRMLGNTLSPESAHELGSAGDYTFYLYAEGPDAAFAAGIDEPYAGEYAALAALTEPLMTAFSCYEPLDKYAALIGKKIEFTTTDPDGNAVSSEDLFGQNEITVLNIWATWCGPCIGELAELQQIHLRLKEKGCGVAGLLIDNDLSAARSLMDRYGVAYPVILAPANIDSLFTLEGYPTTFFIGRDGTVLTAPIVGAYVTEYESTVEGLLSGQD